MRTAIDTNVISALWSSEPFAGQIAELLGRASSEGALVVAAPVYAELMAHPKATPRFVDQFLASTRVDAEFFLEEAVWHETARSFAAYARRRRASAGGAPKRLLVDFLVGAHALLSSDRLFTLDPDRYRHDFPKLRLLGIGLS